MSRFFSGTTCYYRPLINVSFYFLNVFWLKSNNKTLAQKLQHYSSRLGWQKKGEFLVIFLVITKNDALYIYIFEYVFVHIIGSVIAQDPSCPSDVDQLVGLVSRNFLKKHEVTLPCYYRSPCFDYIVYNQLCMERLRRKTRCRELPV